LICGVGLVVGCGAGPQDVTETGVNPAPVACDVTIEAIEPAPDTRDVSVDASVWATFTGIIPEGAVWSLGIEGVEGVATLSADGTQATFTPDAGLDYETVYTINAAACGDTQTADFLTVVTPVEPTMLEGVTFGIQEEAFDVIEPKAADAFLALFDKQGGLFGTLGVQLSDFNAATNSFIGTGGVIDSLTDEVRCDLLVETTVDYSGNPTLSFGPDDLSIDLGQEQTIVLEDLTVNGRVSADGKSLLNPTISLLLAIETIDGSPFDGCQPELGACLPCTSSASGECQLFVAAVDEAADIGRDIAAECAGG